MDRSVGHLPISPACGLCFALSQSGIHFRVRRVCILLPVLRCQFRNLRSEPTGLGWGICSLQADPPDVVVTTPMPSAPMSSQRKARPTRDSGHSRWPLAPFGTSSSVAVPACGANQHRQYSCDFATLDAMSYIAGVCRWSGWCWGLRSMYVISAAQNISSVF